MLPHVLNKLFLLFVGVSAQPILFADRNKLFYCDIRHSLLHSSSNLVVRIRQKSRINAMFDLFYIHTYVIQDGFVVGRGVSPIPEDPAFLDIANNVVSFMDARYLMCEKSAIGAICEMDASIRIAVPWETYVIRGA